MKDDYNIEEVEKANKRRFDFIFSNGKKERLRVPTVDMYYKIYYAVNTDEKIEGLCDWLNKLRQLPHYKPPYCMTVETADGDKVPFKTTFHELKIVSDYTNTSFIRQRELDLLTFWSFYKDAIIYNLSRSEKGREYLRDAYYMAQTKPDREAISKLIALQGEKGIKPKIVSRHNTKNEQLTNNGSATSPQERQEN